MLCSQIWLQIKPKQLLNYKKKAAGDTKVYLSGVASVLREGPKANTTGSAALLLQEESERCRTARQILCCGRCCCTRCCAGRSLSGLSPSFSCMDRSRLKNTISWNSQNLDSKVCDCGRGVEEYCGDIGSLLRWEQVQTRCKGERDHSAAHLWVIGSCNDNNAAWRWNAPVQPWCRQTDRLDMRFQLRPQKGSQIMDSFTNHSDVRKHIFWRCRKRQSLPFFFYQRSTWAWLLPVEWLVSSLSAWLFLPGAQTALDWSAGH